MEKVWEIKNPEEYLKGGGKKPRQRPPREERDPAAAYSRSRLVWGLGQLYNDQLVKGAASLVMMLLFCGAVAVVAIYSRSLPALLLSRNISRSTAFLCAEALLFAALLFWASNASGAYHRAARSRMKRFTGVQSRITPFLGSLAVPGWGQYLNGQPVKGGLFSACAVIGGFAVLAVVLTYLAWPALEASNSRFIVEGIFAVCLLLVPPVPLLWTISAYDALKVSRDDLLKEPFGERIKAAYYRGRTQGWVRGVFPQIKGTFLLVLFLCFLTLVDHYLIPSGFYTTLLASARARLQERGMTITPELIGKSLEFIASW